jgi:hypothetical protein
MIKTTMPLSAIQRSIYAQLRASRELFDMVRELADIAGEDPDEKRMRRLASLSERMLQLGKRLSDDAVTTGEQLLDYTKEA